jgi:predicted HicB family RNase H-like nuclease
MTKAVQLLKEAEQLAQSVETWADLSNALFDPFEGLLTKAFPTRAEREAFAQTEEYQKIRELMSRAIEQHGLVAGATPKKKSGRFVVRLPQSLHAALEREARLEGVSLNQLVVAKLAAQLSELVARKTG